MKSKSITIFFFLTFLSSSLFAFEYKNLNYNVKDDGTASVATNTNVVGNIEIPSDILYEDKNYSVNSIEDFAFFGSSITSISIPKSVTSIGKSALSNCKNLTSISIPNSVTFIGGGAFSWDTNLNSISISSSVTSIGKSAFDHCSNLLEISVDTNNEKYSSLNGVLFNKDKSRIILCLEAVKSFTIPNTVTTIGESAFSQCKNLTSISIPNSVITIEDRAFYWCPNLQSINLPNSVTSIGNYAFWGTGITSLSIPNTVTSINEYTFSECYNLKSISIPNSVDTIRYSAFSRCEVLDSVYIPNSVRYIGSYAFSGCWNMSTVSIPKSVTFLGEASFGGCTLLSKIYMQSTEPISIFETTFNDVDKNSCILYVPVGSQNKYSTVANWLDFNNIVEEDDYPTIISQTDSPIKSIYGTNNNVIIKGAKLGSNVKIYNQLGVLITSSIVTDNEIDISIPSGIYVVNVNKSTFKVVVR